jgi:hypothetical protein
LASVNGIRALRTSEQLPAALCQRQGDDVTVRAYFAPLLPPLVLCHGGLDFLIGGSLLRRAVAARSLLAGRCLWRTVTTVTTFREMARHVVRRRRSMVRRGGE